MRYRGDTFIFPFILQDEEGNTQKFLAGDKVRFGAKKNICLNECCLYKEKTIEEEVEEIQFIFDPTETSKLKTCKYIIELELERNGQIDTIFQGEIEVKGDVVNGTETNSNT